MGSTLLLIAPWAIRTLVESAANDLIVIAADKHPTKPTTTAQHFIRETDKLCIIILALLIFTFYFLLRLPPMHRHIDHLSHWIVHAHFGEAAVARFLIRLALGAGCRGGL